MNKLGSAIFGHSLRPCLLNRCVLARRGWAGEKSALLSILRDW